MPMDGITLGAVAEELTAALSAGRVDRIQQPEKDEIVLTIRAGGKNHKLLLSANPNHARAHLTRAQVTSPDTPPMFCMLLRKHLGGARFLRVEQQGADRVLHVCFEAMDELGDLCRRTLVLEVMGRHSNLVLLEENGRIVDCARHVTQDISRVRELLPGLPYEAPPAQDKLNPYTAEEQDYIDALSPLVGQRIDKAILQTVSGVSTQLSRELSFRICGQEQAELSIGLLTGAAERLHAFFAQRHTAPTLLVDEQENPIDVFPFPYLSRSGERQRARDSLSEAIEEFYLQRDRRDRIREKSHALRRFLQNALERAEKKRAIQLQTLQDAKDRDQLRKKGDLITAQMHAMERGKAFVDVPDYYEEGMPLLRIELDPALSPAENAQRYYKRYNKLKAAAELTKEQLQKNEEEIAYFEGQLDNLDKCMAMEELAEIRQEMEREGYLRQSSGRKKQKEAPSKPMAFRSSAGLTILVGKNNVQNDRLTFSAAPEETWLHAKDMPGSHVILRSARPDQASLLEAAKLAAWFSRGKHGQNVPVDYTLRRYVKKPSGARPGYVIYTNQTTLFVDPDESLVARLECRP